MTGGPCARLCANAATKAHGRESSMQWQTEITQEAVRSMPLRGPTRSELTKAREDSARLAGRHSLLTSCPSALRWTSSLDTFIPSAHTRQLDVIRRTLKPKRFPCA
jgi:hypothetical protein